MSRFLGFLIVFVLPGVISFIPNTVSATSGETWVSNPIRKIAEMPTGSLVGGATTCGGYMGVIEVKGQRGYKDACIFGGMEGTRVARYVGPGDAFVYGVAYKTDNAFLPVQGLCTGMVRCAYGQAGDTLLQQVPIDGGTFTYAIIKNFTNYLSRQVGASTYYDFTYTGNSVYLRAGEGYVSTGTTSISANGRWALIELPAYGFIRLDLQTLQYKRIATRDSLFMQIAQRLESAVSDDGRWVIITGYTVDSLMYEINESCGDTLTDTSSEYFLSGTKACNSAVVGLHDLFPGPLIVHTPRFSTDGTRLQLFVQKNSQLLTATLSPGSMGNGNPLYLAFGDSFTSGEGEASDGFYTSDTNTVANQCHVSTRSYPYLLGNSWEIVTSNLACSGARISGVREASQRYIQDTKGTWPSIVSVGVGGNDVDFMGKLKSCIGIGTCEWAKKESRLTTAYEIKALFPKVVSIISELKTNVSPASLFIVGYPNVINDQPNAQCSAVIAGLLDITERRYMSESIKFINNVLKAAAEYSKITYVDIEDAYQGERLCDQRESAMNGVRYGNDIAPIPLLGNFKFVGAESFHPTPRGHELAALTINAKLGSFWTSPYCSQCVFTGTELSLPAYWLEGAGVDGPVLRQLANIFMESQTFVDVSSATFSFLPDSFAPGTTVRFELHSDVQQLGEYVVSDDGSLQGSLTISPNIEGYHTIHAYGQSRSGESLDMYQTVYIDTTQQGMGEVRAVTSQNDDDKNYQADRPSQNNTNLLAATQVKASQDTGAASVLAEKGASTGVESGGASAKNRDGDESNIWYIAILAVIGLLSLRFYIKKRQNATEAS